MYFYINLLKNYKYEIMKYEIWNINKKYEIIIINCVIPENLFQKMSYIPENFDYSNI